MIQYAVEEAVNSGLEEIIFVTSEGKEGLVKYFQPNERLESFLKDNGKTDLLNLVKKIGAMVDIKVTTQEQQLGLGHAVSCAEELVAGEDFAVILGDDLVFNDNNPCTSQLLQIYKEHNSSVIGVMDVPREETSKYGIVAGEATEDNKLIKMSKMVEKPKPSDAPSTLATPGRYILKNSIFKYLKEIPRGAGGEFQLTDAINFQAEKESVYAYQFEGDRHDTGTPMNHFETSLEVVLRDENLRSEALEIMKKKINKYS